MKKILLILLILISNTLYSSEMIYRVLDVFVLGDSIENVLPLIKVDSLITQYDNDNKLDKVVVNDFYFNKNSVKVVLLFVNNRLYGVRYYPINDKEFYKYLKYLDRIFKVYSRYKIWNYYDRILIEYDMIEKGFIDTFKHYDVDMILKYPKEYKLKF